MKFIHEYIILRNINNISMYLFLFPIKSYIYLEEDNNYLMLNYNFCNILGRGIILFFNEYIRRNILFYFRIIIDAIKIRYRNTRR